MSVEFTSPGECRNFDERMYDACHPVNDMRSGARYFRVLFADCIPVLLNDFYVESLVSSGRLGLKKRDRSDKLR